MIRGADILLPYSGAYPESVDIRLHPPVIFIDDELQYYLPIYALVSQLVLPVRIFDRCVIVIRAM